MSHLSTNQIYDVIVIGLGAMGSATIYQLSKTNLKICGIDQYAPPHSWGSSHGESRITRQTIGEEESYIPLVQESNKIWKTMEQESGQELFHKSGGYVLGHENSNMLFHNTKDFIARLVELAKKYNINYALKTADDIRREIPMLQVTPDTIGFYEPDAGILYPEKIITAFLKLAEKNGASFLWNDKVTDWYFKDGLIHIKTNLQEFVTKKAIFTTGPWIQDFLPNNLKPEVKVYKQEMFWFKPAFTKNKSEARYSVEADAFPWIIWLGKNLDDFRTFFPATKDGTKGIKFMTEQYTNEVHPNRTHYFITDEQVRSVYEKYVQPSIKGITRTCLKRSACFYTVTKDARFLMDFHPACKSVLFASPCSGHGFKHSAAIGQLLAKNIRKDDGVFDWGLLG